MLMHYLKSRKTLYLLESYGENAGGVLPGEIDEDMDPSMAVIVATRNLDQLIYFTRALDLLEKRDKRRALSKTVC